MKRDDFLKPQKEPISVKGRRQLDVIKLDYSLKRESVMHSSKSEKKDVVVTKTPK